MIQMFTDEVFKQAGQNGDGCVYDTVLQKQIIGQIQCNRKLDGAEEEINYCTDSGCTNYLDTCEEKEYYEDNELCYGFPFDIVMDRFNVIESLMVLKKK